MCIVIYDNNYVSDCSESKWLQYYNLYFKSPREYFVYHHLFHLTAHATPRHHDVGHHFIYRWHSKRSSRCTTSLLPRPKIIFPNTHLMPRPPILPVHELLTSVKGYPQYPSNIEISLTFFVFHFTNTIRPVIIQTLI